MTDEQKQTQAEVLEAHDATLSDVVDTRTDEWGWLRWSFKCALCGTIHREEYSISPEGEVDS